MILISSDEEDINGSHVIVEDINVSNLIEEANGYQKNSEFLNMKYYIIHIINII